MKPLKCDLYDRKVLILLLITGMPEDKYIQHVVAALAVVPGEEVRKVRIGELLLQVRRLQLFKTFYGNTGTDEKGESNLGQPDGPMEAMQAPPAHEGNGQGASSTLLGAPSPYPGNLEINTTGAPSHKRVKRSGMQSTSAGKSRGARSEKPL